jgi:molybdopterin molybdotransferase
MRCIVSREKGEYVATTTGEQGSGILMSMVRANALMVLPEEKTTFNTGEIVKVQLLDRGFELKEKPEYH